MSYKIDITGKDEYIEITLFGEIDLEQLYAVNSYLYNTHSFTTHPYAIWNLTECTIDTNYEAIELFAKSIQSDRIFSTPGKTAIITNDTHLKTLVHPFVELVGEMPFELGAFKDRLSAIKWIKKPVMV